MIVCPGIVEDIDRQERRERKTDSNLLCLLFLPSPQTKNKYAQDLHLHSRTEYSGNQIQWWHKRFLPETHGRIHIVVFVVYQPVHAALSKRADRHIACFSAI